MAELKDLIRNAIEQNDLEHERQYALEEYDEMLNKLFMEV